MSTIFVLFFLLSIVTLTWGLLSPTGISKVLRRSLTRSLIARYVSLAAIVSFIGIGITAPPQQQTIVITPAATKLASVKSATDTSSSTKTPIITTEIRTETESIAYEQTTQNDATLEAGKTALGTVGQNGTRTRTYEVTLTDRIETARKLVKDEITTQPVAEITRVGTKAPPVTSSCDPNYSGACVPIASDVDCGGGRGNGPAYVYGTVRVVGTDIYGLDRDGNGYGCE